ncbi:MAG TPA: response regulator [Polyangia bacterium]|jgi:DNA-binding response OmpR family regulator
MSVDAAPYQVLLVDDEPTVLAALRLAFEDDPAFAMTVARSAEEALAVAGARVVDLVITDKNLPDRSGIELARQLRRTHPWLPIILITGYANAPSRKEGSEIGLAAYLEKPFADIFAVPALALEVLRRNKAAS